MIIAITGAIGVGQVAVAKLLGHERLGTTAIYTHPNQREVEKAFERLETS